MKSICISLIIFVFFLVSQNVSGQGLPLFDDISSGPTQEGVNYKRLYKFDSTLFISGTYDNDKQIIYGMYLNSVDKFTYDQLETRNTQLNIIKEIFVEKFGKPDIDKSNDYLPFMPDGQTYSIYIWNAGNTLITMISIAGRPTDNYIKIEIYDIHLLNEISK